MKAHLAAALALSALAALALAQAAQAAGDAKAGRKKALQCQTCHGMDGVAKIAEAPHLAGQSEGYLVKAFTDYKTGARKNEMMSLVAPAISEQDIEDLAAFYASLKLE